MNDKPKTKRRWYQFSLRTMFVGMTLVSIPLAWVGYSLNWIKERREWLGKQTSRYEPVGPRKQQTAPRGLWLFGEQGEETVLSDTMHADEAHRLFPEAKIWVNDEQ